MRFDSTTRMIIDGRTSGFCKVIVGRAPGTILGCHGVGEGAVDIELFVVVSRSARM